MMRSILALLSVVLAAGRLYAQEPTINPDRPDQSDGVYTLPQGLFQVEQGITSQAEGLQHNLQLRYGILPKLELRLATDLSYGTPMSWLGPDHLTPSIKWALLEGSRYYPSLTLVTTLDYVPPEKQVSWDLSFAAEYSLSEHWALVSNVGSAEGLKAMGVTLEVSYAPEDRLSFFAEYYATLSLRRIGASHGIDLGVGYQLSPRVQIDLAGGRSILGIDRGSSFLTMGISICSGK